MALNARQHEATQKGNSLVSDLLDETHVALAWDTVRRYYGVRAQTQLGKAAISAQKILTDSQRIEHYQSLALWKEYLANHPEMSFPEPPDLDFLSTNPHLDPFEPKQLRQFRDLLSFWMTLAKSDMPHLATLAAETSAELQPLFDQLKDMFTANGDWSLSVSPTYATLCHQKERLQERLTQQVLASLKRYADYLSEAVVFERNGRKVLAVSAQHKNRVRGMVQDISASGQSLFIEPESLIEVQNALVETDANIREELLRIRREVSRQILAMPQWSTIIPTLVECDRLQALCLTAREVDAQIIMPNKDQQLSLLRARHPYLDERFARLRQLADDLPAEDKHHMVAFDLHLDSETRGLIISGANTGGKTVTLKTTGLMALMANAGFPVPVDEGSKVPVYDCILADIGDHQSMTQSLSTFASHLRVLKTMAQQKGTTTLVLIDEMGSGTDPLEADALSQALMETFVDNQIHFICTTHHQVLCTFALNHAQLENGSMAFDSHQLRPTYRFTQGVPGRSHALEIAQKTGMDTDLLTRARSLLDNNMVDIQAAILSLQQSAKDLERMKSKVRRQELKLHHRIKETKNKEKALQDAQEAIQEKARERVQKKVSQAESKLRVLLQELESNKQKRHAAAAFQQLKKEIQEPEPESKVKKLDLPVSGTPVEKWAKGDSVYLRSFQKSGKLESVDRRSARVDLGGMTVTASIKDILHLSPLQESDADEVLIHEHHDFDQPAQLEVSFIGMHVQDALIELDRSLDKALSRGLPYLTVIHGHGTGRLKTAIRDHLSRHPAKQAWQMVLRPENDGQTELKFD